MSNLIQTQCPHPNYVCKHLTKSATILTTIPPLLGFLHKPSKLHFYNADTLFTKHRLSIHPQKTLPNKRSTTPSAMSHSHSLQQQSTGAGRLNNSNTADNAHCTWPSVSPTPNPQDDIITHINSHLAWQDSAPLPWDTRAFVHEFHAYQAHAASREMRRRGSAGTLIVDWDGEGEGQAYFRGRTEEVEAFTVPTKEPHYSGGGEGVGRHDSVVDQRVTRPSAESFIAAYPPARNAVFGHDPATRFAYGYNGDAMHVSRRPLPSSYINTNSHSQTHTSPSHSEVSEYFALPVESYMPGVPFRVSQNEGRDKSLPPLPIKGKVVGFVEKVMRKLDGSGVLGQIRKKRARERKSGGYV